MSEYGSFFVGGVGSFAVSVGASAASSDRGRPSALARLSAALRCPALSAALDARCAAPFRTRFPEAAALLATLPDAAHAALARDFFTVHLAVFVTATLAAAAIVADQARIRYLDAWVLCTGAMTGGSLSPVDMGLVPRGAQVVLWFLMAAGGITVTALWPLGYRLYVFRARLKPALRRARRLGPELRRAARPRLPRAISEDRTLAAPEAESQQQQVQPQPGAVGSPESAAAVLAALEAADADTLLAELSAQDEGLAAVAAITLVYVVFWTLVVMGALWRRAVAPDSPLPAALAARGLRPGWYALFFATSALNNVGLSLFSTSAAPMANDAPTLLALAAASLAGNTAWPLALRFLLRLCERVAARLSARAGGRSAAGRGPGRGSGGGALLQGCAAFSRGCRYALQHPQTCYHLLFPARETAALLAALLLTNTVQLAVFGGSSAHLPAVVAAVPGGRDRAAVAFFTAVNSRSTGLSAVDLNALAPVMLIILAFMMWFSPYPLVALWARDDADGGADLFAATAKSEAKSPRFPVVRAFNRRYVKRHATWLTLAAVTLAAAEAPLLAMPAQDGSGRSPTSLFALIFEVLSAYGTNGMSLGWPGANFNLCGMFHPISKLVLIALMFLGRHRSMPRRVDPPLAGRVAAAEELAAAVQAKLAAWAASRAHGSSVQAASASMLARVGSFTQDSITAALALIRNSSTETLAAMAAGTRQQRAAAVDAAMERQRTGAPPPLLHVPFAPLPPIPPTPRTPLPTTPEGGARMFGRAERTPEGDAAAGLHAEPLQEEEREEEETEERAAAEEAAAADVSLRQDEDGEDNV